MSDPKDRKYTRDHEWAKSEGGEVVVGISRFAVDQLGDVTLVETPKVGSEVRRGEAMGTIESVKTVSDLMAPVSGKVAAVNTALADAPQAVNEDPYGAGWMVRLVPSNPGEMDDLLDADAYAAHVAAES